MLKGKVCQRVWQCTHSVSERFLVGSPSPGLILPFNWALCQQPWQVSSELSGAACVCVRVMKRQTEIVLINPLDRLKCTFCTLYTISVQQGVTAHLWSALLCDAHCKNSAPLMHELDHLLGVNPPHTHTHPHTFHNAAVQHNVFIGLLSRHLDQTMTVSVLCAFLFFRESRCDQLKCHKLRKKF